MARHYRHMYEGKNAGASSVHGMDEIHNREKAANKLACQRASDMLPPDAFADDVEDDDTKPYRPSITWIPSKSAIDM
jgi:hypothetical protein